MALKSSKMKIFKKNNFAKGRNVYSLRAQHLRFTGV